MSYQNPQDRELAIRDFALAHLLAIELSARGHHASIVHLLRPDIAKEISDRADECIPTHRVIR